MATYRFGPFAAVNVAGDPVQSGAFAVYAVDDTQFTTPLTAKDPVTGDTLSTIEVHDYVGMAFTVEDHGVVLLRSGSAPAIQVHSPDGYAAEATSARQAAEAAQAAAEASAISVQADANRAEDARDQAVAAAESVLAPTDEQVAALLEDDTTPSETRATLDGILQALPSVSVPDATTSVKGIVELATTTETQTGTDSTRAVTPAGLASRTATTSRTGVVELATAAETQTGTDSQRAVTPAGAASAYYTKAQVDGLISAVQGAMVSTEDLLVSVYRADSIAPSANPFVIPLLICPFPLRLTSLALVSYQTAITVGVSNTNWWLTRVRYVRQSVSNTAVAIATKTTRSTEGGGEPAGEAIVPLKPWVYQADDVSSVDMQTGDVVSMVFASTGSPTTITGPLVITMGYQPL